MSILLRIATFAIPIPLWLIAGVSLWVWLDKESAVRLAVNDAVEELIAGSKIDSLERQVEAEQRLRKLAETVARQNEERAARIAEANRSYADLLISLESQKQELANELREISQRDLGGICHVDGELLGRLRAR